MNCHLRETKFVVADFDFDNEIDDLVFQTILIVEAEDAGFKTDWRLYEPEMSELVIEYRKAEKDLKSLFDVRQQAFIKAHFQKR